MKSYAQDGGECFRKWHATRLKNLLRLSGEPPKDLCIDQIHITVCCRYVQSLLSNRGVRKYLSKYHAVQLRTLECLVEEFERTSGIGSIDNSAPIR